MQIPNIRLTFAAMIASVNKAIDEQKQKTKSKESGTTTSSDIAAKARELVDDVTKKSK